MGNFTPKVKFTTEFDGDTISMELARLKRKHVVALSPFMKESDAEGNTTMSFEDQAKFAEALTGVLPEVVFNFSGVTTSDGQPVSLETVISEAYYNGLVVLITQELFAISYPNGQQLGNSQQPSSVT